MSFALTAEGLALRYQYPIVPNPSARGLPQTLWFNTQPCYEKR